MPEFITADTIRPFRKSVRNAMPGVRSSHMAEAVAAALGFRTSAALDAAMRATDRLPIPEGPDSQAFVSRLRSLGAPLDDKAAAKLENAWTDYGLSTGMTAGTLLPRDERVMVMSRIAVGLQNGQTVQGTLASLQNYFQISPDPEDRLLRDALSSIRKTLEEKEDLESALRGHFTHLDQLFIITSGRAVNGGCLRSYSSLEFDHILSPVAAAVRVLALLIEMGVQIPFILSEVPKRLRRYQEGSPERLLLPAFTEWKAEDASLEGVLTHLNRFLRYRDKVSIAGIESLWFDVLKDAASKLDRVGAGA